MTMAFPTLCSAKPAILICLVLAWLSTPELLHANEVSVSHSLSGGGPSSTTDSPACQHPLYCNNTLLCIVQMSGLFSDSKTFVDLPIKPDYSLNEVLSAFAAMGPTPNDEGITAWLSKYFQQPGADLEDWTPPDWNESPPMLKDIADAQLRAFASALVAIWPSLGRKTNSSYGQSTPVLQEEQGTSSLLQVPNGFIVPGGRFREYYYWDTYFIIQGLLVSEMVESAKGIIQNFLSLVNTIGFVPNGGRVYYMNRSQPPMLTLMVREYWRKTGDLDFIRSALPVLASEYSFWQDHRSITVTAPSNDNDEEDDDDDNDNGKTSTYQLNVYGSSLNLPRPEGWVEDVTLAQDRKSDMDSARSLWHNVASAAETGWDFSSRWCSVDANLSTLVTSVIVPVDLNSILYDVERTLGDFYLLVEQAGLASTMHKAAEQRKQAIEAVLWSEQSGCWMDLDSRTNMHVSKTFYVSNILPLWTNAYDPSPARSEQIVRYLTNVTGALSFPGGVPTSLDYNSTQQWDFPNAWPPEQLFVIEGLNRLPFQPVAQQLAFTLTQEWVSSNYLSWQVTGGMFEKYNATQVGVPGGGGEYPTQLGFGWSNGVVLHLLRQFGDRLQAPPTSSTAPPLPAKQHHGVDSDQVIEALYQRSPRSSDIDPLFCQVPPLVN